MTDKNDQNSGSRPFNTFVYVSVFVGQFLLVYYVFFVNYKRL